MKYCKDCKYHYLSFLDRVLLLNENAICIKNRSLVTGEMNSRMFCTALRCYSLDCGVEAKWFEPKENK
jgi:hypothetical protein